jgi:D-threonate/D-erythronate kinase
MRDGDAQAGDRGSISTPEWERLLLIADDLTGALDTAAQFAALPGAVSVHWRAVDGRSSLSFASGARERSGDEADAAIAALLAPQVIDRSTLAYAKLDSLLRGNPAREIAAWLRFGPFDQCLVAPAFPAHGRITRGGRQYRLSGGSLSMLPTDLVADLAQLGVEAAFVRAGDPAPSGVSLWDAETDADLDAIVAAGRAARGRTLWCGSGGLASALARSAGLSTLTAFAFDRPVLGLFGSDQPITAAQVDACGDLGVAIEDGGAAAIREIAARLAVGGVALVRLALPQDVARDEAARRIAREFGRLLADLSAPKTLFVAGGETLMAVCDALGADRLEIEGQAEPGVPVSRLRGGRFSGVRVVSKSGAFGDRDLLRRHLGIETLPSTGALS